MCLYPRIIKNRKYTSTKKNKGVVPEMVDKRVLWVPVGCGKCMECKKKKGREWQVRLNEEIRRNKVGKFVNFTFSNEALKEIGGEINGLDGYELDNEIARIAVRRYYERWRKKYKVSCKHWLVTEIGGNGTERLHLHGIMWTDEIEDIKEIWKYGMVHIGEWVNEQTIGYIVKYVHKTDEKHKEYRSKIFASPAIGRGYTERIDSEGNKYEEKGTDETYRGRTGQKIALPIYYRNAIYSEEEREKLWIEKIDKEERWVDGKRVSVKEGDEDYYKMLREARKKSKRMGYGDNEIDWERRRYENERRNIKKKEEIKKREGKK